MDAVATILERERDALETLHFKLVVTRLMLDRGELRYLARAAAEVDRARTRCREIDLLRAATVDRHHPGASLRQLASYAGGPWPAIFRDHHDVLAPLVAEIDRAAHGNVEVVTAGLERLREKVPVGSGLKLLDRSSTDDEELERLADEAALTAVLRTSTRLRMHDLLDFLR